MVLIPTVLWIGATAAISTALIATRRPTPAGAVVLYVLAAGLSGGGLWGLVSISQPLTAHQADHALAEAVSLSSLQISQTEAQIAFKLGDGVQLQHVTLRSVDEYCEGTEWPAPGAATVSVPLRCAGGVSTSGRWRLSTVAARGEERVTVVWADPDVVLPPNAIRRPLP